MNSSGCWNVRARPRAGPRSRARHAVTSSPWSQHRPAVGAQEPGQHAEQGRLAGAVGADQPGDGARGDVEATRRTAPRSPPKRTVMPVGRRATGRRRRRPRLVGRRIGHGRRHETCSATSGRRPPTACRFDRRRRSLEELRVDRGCRARRAGPAAQLAGSARPARRRGTWPRRWRRGRRAPAAGCAVHGREVVPAAARGA